MKSPAARSTRGGAYHYTVLYTDVRYFWRGFKFWLISSPGVKFYWKILHDTQCPMQHLWVSDHFAKHMLLRPMSFYYISSTATNYVRTLDFWNSDVFFFFCKTLYLKKKKRPIFFFSFPCKTFRFHVGLFFPVYHIRYYDTWVGIWYYILSYIVLRRRRRRFPEPRGEIEWKIYKTCNTSESIRQNVILHYCVLHSTRNANALNSNTHTLRIHDAENRI